jgi:glycosyltransferase involved in cell wall biosynthesis
VALNRQALLRGLDYILQPATFFLRDAWQQVGGLNADLRFCMDWDILLRIAAAYPAVLINEFLAVSREYEETKTSSGKLKRTAEISRMIQSHTGQELTPGSLYYMFETLLDITNNSEMAPVRGHLYAGMQALQKQFAQEYGNLDGFPEHSDPQDRVYLPFPSAIEPQRSIDLADERLPTISIVTPSFNQAQFLGQTLDSLINQHYPKLELMVFDGGSTDGSVELLRQYTNHLAHWVSERDRGPAHAINKGLKLATGDIIGWVNSDDMLAADALWEVARAFAEDPNLDMVFANALYIDEQNQLHIADHGTHRTGLYYGEMQALQLIPAYWQYIHAVPQPTVFFRRRLLDISGALDESYHFIFDFELFWRFAWKAKMKKLERTMAFYRIHAASKTSDWNKFLIELYRFSRPWWPRLYTAQFRSTLRGYVVGYMRRRFGNRPRDVWFWGAAALVAASAITRIGNPEALQLRLPKARARSAPAQPRRIAVELPTEPQQAPPSPEQLGLSGARERLPYRSIFCSRLWPFHPGHSGGEIRDFHLLRRLLTLSRVEFFALHSPAAENRVDLLEPFVDALHTPETIRVNRPALLKPQALQRSLKSRTASAFRRMSLPVVGPRYHADVTDQFPHIEAYSWAALHEALIERTPDFLFVSPQTNPIALIMQTLDLPTRLIMASYDVEAVRIHRMAQAHHGLARVAMDIEARRAVAFERDNLARYDGVIAVSELDKQMFVSDYGFAPERVLVIENSVDPVYFRFSERLHHERPQIVFVGSLSYLPNHQAALRLVQRIMPLVRQRFPTAQVWIVGQGPRPELLAYHDGDHTVITGTVPDVRPYLAHASLTCVPLVVGSGTKYKVLEALCAGVPVVCTPLTVEGLALQHGEHVLLAESDEHLASTIVELLEQPELAAKLACAGHDIVEQLYTWDANLVRLDAWLAGLMALPRRNAPLLELLPATQITALADVDSEPLNDEDILIERWTTPFHTDGR